MILFLNRAKGFVLGNILYLVAFLLLLTSFLLATENPFSNAFTIWNYKDSQFKILKNINEPDAISHMKKLFDGPYNYTELISWVHNTIDWTDVKPNPAPKDPFSIIELGEGKCGEFAILYASACIANGYDCRIVVILRGNNHEWVEININGIWIHVDPTYPPSNMMVNNPLVYINNNYELNLVVAFKMNSYEIVTDKYNN